MNKLIFTPTQKSGECTKAICNDILPQNDNIVKFNTKVFNKSYLLIQDLYNSQGTKI